MTPEERAAVVLVCSEDWCEPSDGMYGNYGLDLKPEVLTVMIAAQILAAVAEELEASVASARDYLHCVPCPPMCSPSGLHVDYCTNHVANEPGFAAAIRART